MKKFSGAFASGFRSASSSIRMVLVLYLFNLMIALPFALVFRGILADALGGSTLVDRLLSGFDATLYDGFLRSGSKALGTLVSGLEWTALLSMIISTVLDGGILGQLNSADRRFTLASFFGDCGTYLWRFIRLTLLFASVMIVVLLVSTVAFGMIHGPVDRNAVSEVGVFWARILSLSATLFLAGLVVLMSDYARIETARSGAHSMIRASWGGVKFVFRRFFPVVGLQLALVAVSLCVIAVYLSAENAMSVSTGTGILVLLVVQQLTIVLRMFIRVATFAGERHLFLSYLVPQSGSFAEVLTSSAPALTAVPPITPMPDIPALPPPPGTPPLPAEPALVPVKRQLRNLRVQPDSRPRNPGKRKTVSRPASRRKVVRKKGRA